MLNFPSLALFSPPTIPTLFSLFVWGLGLVFFFKSYFCNALSFCFNCKGQIFVWGNVLPWLVHSALPGSILPCPTEMRTVQNQSERLFWPHDQQKGRVRVH